MDLLLKNGKVHTLNEAAETAEAIGIEDGRICFVGSDEEAEGFSCEKVVNLKGRCVLPGFNDSHIHSVTYAWYENSLKMQNAGSREEVVSMAKAFMAGRDYSGGKWFIGRGWNHNRFPDKKMLSKGDLDEISKEVPIAFLRVCGHVSVVNSAALAQILKLPQAKDLEEYIDRENGILLEGAARLFMAAIRPYRKEDIIELITYAAEKLNACGITSIHSDDITLLPAATEYEILEAFQAMAEAGALNVRVYCLASCADPAKQLPGYIKIGFKSGKGDAFFRMGPVKLIVDGALGGKTAALTDPYADDEKNYGVTYYTVEELAEVIGTCCENGLDVTVHAIGDRGMEIAAKAIAKVNAVHGRNRRHGLLHAQIGNDSVFDLMAEENIQAFMQPVFLDSDMDYAEGAVSKPEVKRFYAFKTMLDKGINVAGSACSPVESFNVLANIQYAVTREKLDGGPENGWHPEERLSVLEAVKLFTSRGAYASYEEAEKGTLEIGKYADLTVLSEDLFSVDPHCIKDIQVEQTYVGGRLVYSKA